MNHLHRSFGKLILAKNIDVFKTTGYIFKTNLPFTDIFFGDGFPIKTFEEQPLMA